MISRDRSYHDDGCEQAQRNKNDELACLHGVSPFFVIDLQTNKNALQTRKFLHG